MVFCNMTDEIIHKSICIVTILILIDGFLQCLILLSSFLSALVTILILIDGFLQSTFKRQEKFVKMCHNPYFNRWFSAI